MGAKKGTCVLIDRSTSVLWFVSVQGVQNRTWTKPKVCQILALDMLWASGFQNEAENELRRAGKLGYELHAMGNLDFAFSLSFGALRIRIWSMRSIDT